MSTVFVVETNEGELIEVAVRRGAMKFIDPLAPLLPDDTTVIPVDNSSQGIQTIGDIKKAIETGVICPREEE